MAAVVDMAVVEVTVVADTEDIEYPNDSSNVSEKTPQSFIQR